MKPKYFYGVDEYGNVHAFKSKGYRNELIDMNMIEPYLYFVVGNRHYVYSNKLYESFAMFPDDTLTDGIELLTKVQPNDLHSKCFNQCYHYSVVNCDGTVYEITVLQNFKRHKQVYNNDS